MKFKYNGIDLDSHASNYPFPSNGDIGLIAGDMIETNDEIYSYPDFVASMDCVYNIYLGRASIPLQVPWKEEG